MKKIILIILALSICLTTNVLANNPEKNAEVVKKIGENQSKSVLDILKKIFTKKASEKEIKQLINMVDSSFKKNHEKSLLAWKSFVNDYNQIEKKYAKNKKYKKAMEKFDDKVTIVMNQFNNQFNNQGFQFKTNVESLKNTKLYYDQVKKIISGYILAYDSQTIDNVKKLEQGMIEAKKILTNEIKKIDKNTKKK